MENLQKVMKRKSFRQKDINQCKNMRKRRDFIMTVVFNDIYMLSCTLIIR